MALARRVVHLAPYFSFDPVGREDQRTSAGRAFGLVLACLEALRRDDMFHLVLAEADLLKPFLAVHSEERDLVRAMVAAGRLQTGGVCNRFADSCLQGEAIIRNVIHGRLYQERLLKAKPEVYMPLGVAGHCPQLPQIAAKAGFRGMVCSQATTEAPPLSFALAPDGTALLRRRDDWRGDRRDWPRGLDELLAWISEWLRGQKPPILGHDLALLGCEMAAPPGWLLGCSERLGEQEPPIRLSTPHLYFRDVKGEANSGAVPVSGRDTPSSGVAALVTRADLKTANRLTENRLLDAEKWATLAALLGARYPDLALDKAWRQALFGHHHAAIGGAVEVGPYLDLLAGYREALELAAEVEKRSLAYIAGRVETRPRHRAAASLVVFNPLGWTRTDICRARVELTGALASGFRVTDERGREVASQVMGRWREGGNSWVEVAFVATEVPSVGYRVYYLAPAGELPPAGTEAEGEAGIENEHFAIRADADRGGGLTSVYDKQSKREFLNPAVGPGNEIVALAEEPEGERAARELSTTGAMVRAGEQRAEVSALRGPVFSQLRIRTELPDRCAVRQEVILYRGLRRIELRTVLDGYRGENELLALCFPLATSQGLATFEDRFATVVRKAGRSGFGRHTVEEGMRGCGAGSVGNWVDVGAVPFLRVMEGSRQVGAVPLGPCALVTSEGTHGAAAVLGRALLSRGITFTPWLESEDPEADSAGCAFRISLGRDNAYSQRVLAASPQAAVALDQVLARQEWAGVLVGRPDPSGRWPDIPVLVAEPGAGADIARLAEIIAGLVAGDELQIPRSCDFSGLARPAVNCGAALLNRGSLAASLGSDGTLVSLLCRASAGGALAGSPGSSLPEHRSHVFEHALLPHAGGWREAGVVEAGWEFNHPLRAVQAELWGGVLPAVFSLVTVRAPDANGSAPGGSSGVVVSAIKPLGNPLAGCPSRERSAPERGFLVRLYESRGRDTRARLVFGAEPQEAWLTDLNEGGRGEVELVRPGWRRPAAVSLSLGAAEIATVGVRLGPIARSGEPQPLGPEREPSSPIHCRYWDHNLGAAPMGNQPVTVWLRGTLLPGRNTRFTLGVSNDWRDQEISGTVQMMAPGDWQLIPRQVPYRVPPGSQAVYEVMVVLPAEAGGCFLRAMTQDGQRLVQDVLPVGEIEPLSASLTRAEGRYLLRLGNPNPDSVEGQVALVTPMEGWGGVVEGLALGAVSPRLHVFRLEAREEKEYGFEIRGKAGSGWAVAKVMWYGRVQYLCEQ